jgi:hypothetical protein
VTIQLDPTIPVDTPKGPAFAHFPIEWRAGAFPDLRLLHQRNRGMLEFRQQRSKARKEQDDANPTSRPMTIAENDKSAVIPVLNFPSMAPVTFKKAKWMVLKGRAKLSGPRGHENGIELLFSGLDAAIASDKGPSCSSPHSVAGKLKLQVSDWDGIDPFEGASAVMMRGIEGSGASYY